MSLAEQLEAMVGNAGAMPGREMSRFGLTLAKVTNITDDQNFNRVKCLPIGAKDEEETDWCYVMTPMGGMDCGLFFFPQVDDLVVLAYLDEDPHRPLVLGGFWNTEVTPPYKVQDGKFFEYSIRTPKKIELLLYDEEEKQKATLLMPSQALLRLDDEEQKISLQDKDAENALLMDLKEGEITLKAAKKITLMVGDNKIVIEDSGDITITGKSTIQTEGTDIQSKAKSKFAAESATMELKASGQASLKSSGTMELNASGPATLKGAVVKIN